MKVLKFECGCSSMVELQPSKLIAWVRFPSPAPFSESGLWLSIAHIAQSVEHFLGKEEVTGSIPVVGSRCGKKNIGIVFVTLVISGFSIRI
jgi:hypothetical protein